MCSVAMYRAFQAGRNKRKRVRRRERCCARERRVLRNHGLRENLERRGESGEKRRVELVGRALCASRRSFSISPPSPSLPLPPPPSVHHLLFFSSLSLSLAPAFSYSLFLYSSFTFSIPSLLSPFLSLSLAYFALVSASSLPSALFAFSPSSATPLEPLRLAVIISALASG